MRVLRDEPGKSNIKKLDVLDILFVLFAFVSTVVDIVLFITDTVATSGQLAIAYIVVAVLALGLMLKYHRGSLPRTIVGVLLVAVGVVASFLGTHMRFGQYAGFEKASKASISEFRAFCAMFVCATLLAMLLFWSKKREISRKVVLVTDLLFTVVSFLALISQSGLVGEGAVGVVHDDSGLLYQTISYVSAYCEGLTIFLLAEWKRAGELPVKKILFGTVLILTQLFTTLFSGGRGGVVLCVVLLFYALFVLVDRRSIGKILLVLALAGGIAAFAVPRIISAFGINIAGLLRITNFFGGQVRDVGRMELYKKALEACMQHPLFGNGIGSIFYLVDTYSHNMFLDILAETGMIGLLFFLTVMFGFVRRLRSLYPKGSLYRLFTILFICGVTMNLFSGYVWVNQHIWFPVISVMLCYRQGTVCDINLPQERKKHE